MLQLLILVLVLYMGWMHMYGSSTLNSNVVLKSEIIPNILRQVSRWAVASEQDQNPLIAVLHANYAVGYLSALQEIVTDSDIKKYGNIDLLEFSSQVKQVQDNATIRSTYACPNFAPSGPFAMMAGQTLME